MNVATSREAFLSDQRARLNERVAEYRHLDLVTPSGVDLRVVFKTRVSMPNILMALSRIADGTYGECVDCEENIPHGRLLVVPGAIRCVRCQNTEEDRIADKR
ncbi:TraR/DksA family transcriptional regulator [Candidatus Uhrbacteria bacterium]|nr:TraR/DksA family transcriptional regulator [Candidatus Uhrbacteria bacterium]